MRESIDCPQQVKAEEISALSVSEQLKMSITDWSEKVHINDIFFLQRGQLIPDQEIGRNIAL